MDEEPVVVAVRALLTGGGYPKNLVEALKDRFSEAEVRKAIWILIGEGQAEITGERMVRLKEMGDEKLHTIQERYEIQMENRIYEAALLFESLEGRGLINGNGHHLAQEVAAYAVKLLQSRWVKPQD